METKIALLKGTKISKTIHENEWWSVITDVISVLTDSGNPRGYVKDMHRQDEELSKRWVQINTTLSINSAGGSQNVNCVNTEGIFRIIQSIPSSKAEISIRLK